MLSEYRRHHFVEGFQRGLDMLGDRQMLFQSPQQAAGSITRSVVGGRVMDNVPQQFVRRRLIGRGQPLRLADQRLEDDRHGLRLARQGYRLRIAVLRLPKVVQSQERIAQVRQRLRHAAEITNLAREVKALFEVATGR
jgi:hypothetical protein